MRIILLHILSLALIFSFLPGMNATGQTTTVFIVRHAEKYMKDSTDKNPPLSKEGMKRVKALEKKLKSVPLAAVFSTQTIRTEETGRPLASANKIAVQYYNAKDLKSLAEKIRTEYAGKNILVVGHSNSVLPTVNALGGTTILATIPDNVYNLFFKVTIDASGKAVVMQEVYGKDPVAMK